VRNTLAAAGGLLILECSKSIVRDWSSADKADLVRHANNLKVWRNLTHVFPHPYTDADADRWLAFLASMEEPTHWAVEVDGMAVGGIGISLGEGVFSKTGELGYWLGEQYWGRGIMSDAVGHVTPYVMARYELRRVQAAVYEWNPGSMRVLERCGFTLESVARANVYKDGQVIDEVIYALIDTGCG
jgi:ribosomal-protein-alanine N-acetyltransferase